VSEFLNDLKHNFSPYAPFWSEWANYKYSGLTNRDIYLINFHILNKFKINTDNSSMFYNRKTAIVRVTKKLQINYPEFQEWAILEFQFALLKLQGNGLIEEFSEIEIQKLNIDDELKKILFLFKCKTLHKMFSMYSEKLFLEALFFGYILEFLKRFYALKENQNETV
jgi:hypothetical protein